MKTIMIPEKGDKIVLKDGRAGTLLSVPYIVALLMGDEDPCITFDGTHYEEIEYDEDLWKWDSEAGLWEVKE